MVPTRIGSLLDEFHTGPVELQVTVIELGKGDGVAKQFPIRQGVGNIERDAVLYAVANQAERGVLS